MRRSERQRALEVSGARTVASAASLEVTVRGYDDQGQGRPVAGAAVTLAGTTVLTGADGKATLTTPSSGGRYDVTAAKDGVVRSRPMAVLVQWGRVALAGVVGLPAGRGHRRMRRVALAGLLAASAISLAGCGVGAGEGPGNVRLTVTNGFGSRPVGQSRTVQAAGGETIMRLLQRSYKVTTRYGGGFVQSIGGLRGGTEGGRPVDWFYYVNGIEAPTGAAATKLRAGDRIWWDRHDRGSAMRVPAVVGSFPEPFRSGIAGRRLPVRVECERTGAPACDEARRRLSAAGVPAGSAVLGAPSQGRIARVLVGRWPALRRNPEVRLVEEGPARSGVFARVDRGGRTLDVLDPAGRPIRTLGRGAGLVAATRPLAEGQEAVTWIVAGTDDRGVLAAARSLEEGALGDHFALAIDPRGVAVPLPEVGVRGSRP